MKVTYTKRERSATMKLINRLEQLPIPDLAIEETLRDFPRIPARAAITQRDRRDLQKAQRKMVDALKALGEAEDLILDVAFKMDIRVDGEGVLVL